MLCNTGANYDYNGNHVTIYKCIKLTYFYILNLKYIYIYFNKNNKRKNIQKAGISKRWHKFV